MKNGEKEKPKPLVEKVADANPCRRRRRQDHREEADRHRHSAAAATETGRKAGREKARSAEAGGRGQAEGRAEADREEARSAQDRSDRRGDEEGREEAAAEAAGQGCTAAAAEAEGTDLRPARSRRCSTSATDPAGRHRRHAQFQRGARATQGKAAAIPRPGARCSRTGRRCWKKPYGGIESQKPKPRFEIR